MFCPNCGTKLPDDNEVRFCPNCGTSIPVSHPEDSAPEKAPVVAAPPQPKPVVAPAAAASRQSAAQTTAAPSRSAFQKPKEYKNLLTFTLIDIFTLGIYNYFIVYYDTKFANYDESSGKKSPLGALLLCIFFFPYYWYWFYNTAKRVDNILSARFGISKDSAVLCLLLGMFGFPFIAMLIIQNDINMAVGGVTGASPRSTGFGHCSSCGAEDFTDDQPQCPHCGTPYHKPITRHVGFQVFLLLLALLLLILILIASL